MRLARYRKQSGLTQAELALACAWENGQGRIGNYEKDKREPSLDDLRKLSKVLNRSLMDIIDGERQDSVGGEGTDCVSIQAYSREFDDGHTKSEHENTPALILDRRIIVELRNQVENLRFFRVDDSSMQPTLNIGDLAIIDLADTVPSEKSVYAISTSDRRLTMRRFARDVSGKWLARRDNIDKRFYPDEEVKESEFLNLGVKGRVIWHGGAV